MLEEDYGLLQEFLLRRKVAVSIILCNAFLMLVSRLSKACVEKSPGKHREITEETASLRANTEKSPGKHSGSIWEILRNYRRKHQGSTAKLPRKHRGNTGQLPGNRSYQGNRNYRGNRGY